MRQLYTLKFKSSTLKEFGYNMNLTFDEAKEIKAVIALADSQILRSIREITKHKIDNEKLEILFKVRDKLKKPKYFSKVSKYQIIIKKYIEKKFENKYKNEYIQNLENRLNNQEYYNQIKTIQDKINRTLFIPDYITVVMEHSTHYDYMYKNGLIINGKLFKRFSCAAGQARVSTVVFCNTEIIDELNNRLNNGRDITKPNAPSKFNAYFGLAGSATSIVSEPKFIVVKDFENQVSFNANYVTETDWDKDDEIEIKNVTLPMNRIDGMGLISIRQAKKWAKELGLDYVPSQFGLRQNFIKGMLCVFDIHAFCKKRNHKNYIVDTIYKDKNGEYIKADLNDYDVIISESQFKLWNSFPNIETYIENCHKNKLYWSIPQYAPKNAKDILKLNYQFIQTLNLNQQDIEKLASQFVEWIEGVSYSNVPYMLLFLMGINNDEDKIKEYLRSSDNYWIKSLIVNPELKNDKYIRTKIRELIKKKIQNGCMGDIFTDGNFQILVSDPYGFMQHVCGQKVTGLLKENEFYSNYWNERNVKQVDGMRSPLTFCAEHVLLNLRNDMRTRRWYQYCNLGIILNYHGHEVVNFGGADFDLDILATTSSKPICNNIYKDELPVVYNAPKPNKIIFTEDDLYKADKFSFGSIIGSITNKGANGFAMLPILEKLYGKDSREYQVTFSRLKQCCKAQSAQIDKAKIGQEVKGIPKIWIEKQSISVDENGVVLDTDEQIKEKEFFNSILLNKYPYFFKYRYKDCKKAYDIYVDENEVTCHQRFRMTLKKLLNLDRHTKEQKEFIDNYYAHMPVTISDSSMNLLCRYIEGINFDISQKIKTVLSDKFIKLLKNENFKYTECQYENIIEQLKLHIKSKQFDKSLSNNNEDDNDIKKFDIDTIREYKIDNDSLESKLNGICGNPYIVTNCLVDYFYIYNANSNKDILWSTYGKYIFNNVKKNTKNVVKFPIPSENGDIVYMGKKYELREVEV